MASKIAANVRALRLSLSWGIGALARSHFDQQHERDRISPTPKRKPKIVLLGYRTPPDCTLRKRWQTNVYFG
jgi:hypothetical protein